MEWFLAMLVCIASVGGALFGYDTGVVSGAMIQIKTNATAYPAIGGLALDDFWQEAVVSVTPIAAAASCLLCPALNDRMGRRTVNMLAAFLFVVSCVMMALADCLAWLVVGRGLAGVAIGFAATTVPMYIAEVSPSHLRGKLVMVNNICIVGGQVLASLVACAFEVYETGQGWRYMLGIGGAPGVVMFVGFIYLPESPRWLLLRGRRADAAASLRRIRGEATDKEVEEELTAIATSIAAEPDRVSWGGVFKDKTVVAALKIGCFLQFLQQFIGINTLMYYSATILQSSENSGDLSPFDHKNVVATCLSAAVAFSQMVGNFMGVYAVDRYGRATLAKISLLGVALCLGGLGATFTTEMGSALPTVFMCLYLMAFGVGMSPIPWVFNAEVYPLYARATCVSLATFVNWMATFAVSFTFLSLSEATSTDRSNPKDHPDTIFWMYGVVALIGYAVVSKYMPETKGLTLEEITEVFRKRVGGEGARPRGDADYGTIDP
eukprot:TRINITY_DN18494_c0_g2_i1.p1 TRINITY_DN18494_c0_g2~~TRINITY_DN18494_c0_g2_i1.p1  ORF type:complete len:513 (+),score=219.31 TRINITY_DN18494_c0_g2_i1:63-1541(+)